MKARSALVPVLLFLFALYAPLAAAQSQWLKTLQAPNVYAEKTENSNFFSQGGLANTATIVALGVSWDIGQYSNGATTITIKLCYIPPYASSPTICITIYSGSPTGTRLTGSSSASNGQPAKGQFKLTYELEGGTYLFDKAATTLVGQAKQLGLALDKAKRSRS
jgi:hypothetical protein